MANAATNTTSGIQDAVAAEINKSNTETAMAIGEVEVMFIDKVDKLTKAVALFA